MAEKRKGWPIAKRGEDMDISEKNRQAADRLAGWQRDLLRKKREEKS
jgi:hypothetical protein